jgi:hypothetical protein
MFFVENSGKSPGFPGISLIKTLAGEITRDKGMANDRVGKIRDTFQCNGYYWTGGSMVQAAVPGVPAFHGVRFCFRHGGHKAVYLKLI